MKRPTRRTPMQVLWESVEVKSLANGQMRVTPTYRQEKPGVITRMYAARHLAQFINAHLRRKP